MLIDEIRSVRHGAHSRNIHLPVIPTAPSCVKVFIDIPDENAAQLTAGGRELSRMAPEALAREGYRLGTLNQLQVGQFLGLSRIQTEDFLAEHADLYDFDPSELDREAQALANLSSKSDAL